MIFLVIKIKGLTFNFFQLKFFLKVGKAGCSSSKNLNEKNNQNLHLLSLYELFYSQHKTKSVACIKKIHRPSLCVF